jgi:hypothetical protein
MGVEFRDIPESAHGHRLHRGRMVNSALLVIDLVPWAVNKLKRSFSSNTAYGDAAGGATSPAGLVRRDPRLRAAIEEFTDGPDCDDGIFNAGGIRRLLAEHYDGGVDHSELILYLALVHRSIEYFIAQRPVSAPVGIAG